MGIEWFTRSTDLNPIENINLMKQELDKRKVNKWTELIETVRKIGMININKLYENVQINGWKNNEMNSE